MSERRRPGVVTFIGIVLWIQAILAGIAAVAAITFRTAADFQEAVGLSADELLGVGVGEAILAVLIAIVAAGIMGGSGLVRALVGFVMALRIGVASWWLVTHHTGGFLVNGIVTIAIAVFVLWALYGNERSDEFFSS